MIKFAKIGLGNVGMNEIGYLYLWVYPESSLLRWNFTTQSILNVLSEEDRSGKIKKYKVDQNSKEQIIYVANNGELIGYHAVLSE